MAALAAPRCKVAKKYPQSSSPPASTRISPSKNFSIPANSAAIFLLHLGNRGAQRSKLGSGPTLLA